ncbi:putative carboxylesterase 15 [Forsythia ovata]|uniref:Carboxylesterase 15 n=1 Tax=Forsythia ovata TaxID=205694 RepID=A0ABD1NUY8_9LAMI
MGSLAQLFEDYLGIIQVYSDGSIFRSEVTDFSIKVQHDGSAIWKDCLFDKKHNLYLRLYKPAVRFQCQTPNSLLLPRRRLLSRFTHMAQLSQLLHPPFFSVTRDRYLPKFRLYRTVLIHGYPTGSTLTGFS